MAQDQSIFTQAPGFNASLPTARPVSQAPVAEALSGVALEAAKLGAVMYEKDQEARILKAQISQAEGFAALVKQASDSSDDDWTQIQAEFEKGAGKIRQESLKIGQDDKTRSRIDAHFAESQLAANNRVGAIVTAKKASAYAADMDTFKDLLLKQGLVDQDMSHEQVKALWRERAGNGVKQGMLSAKEGAGQIIAFNRHIDYITALQQVTDDPARALGLLKEKQDGAYRQFVDLEEEKRLMLMHQAEARTHQNHDSIARWTQTAIDLIVRGEGDGSKELAEIDKLNPTDQRRKDALGSIGAAQELRSYADQIAMSPIQERDRLLKELGTKAQQGPNREYLTQFRDNLEAMVAADDTAMRKDFAAWAAKTFPVAKGTKETYEQSAIRVLGVAQQKGLIAGPDDPGARRINVLTKEHATGITAEWEAAASDQQYLMARQVMKDSGSYGQQILGQLMSKGETGGRMPFAFAAMLESDPYTASKISQAHKLKEEDLKRMYPTPRAATDVANGARERFANGIGRTMTDTPAKAGWAETYEKVALLERDPAKAEQTLFGKWEIVNSGKTAMRIPRAMRVDQKQRVGLASEYLLGHPAELNAFTDLPNPSLLANELRDKGGWMTYSDHNGEDAGLLLTVEQKPVLDTSGREIRRTWVELMDFKPKNETDWRLARGKYPQAEGAPGVTTITPAMIQETADRARRERTGQRY